MKLNKMNLSFKGRGVGGAVCFYASWPLRHPPVMSRPSFGQITLVSERGHAEGVPLASSEHRLVPSRNWSYVIQDVFLPSVSVLFLFFLPHLRSILYICRHLMIHLHN